LRAAPKKIHHWSQVSGIVNSFFEPSVSWFHATRYCPVSFEMGLVMTKMRGRGWVKTHLLPYLGKL
jgi:hypothetical protein